jgi:hypothetical protein
LCATASRWCCASASARCSCGRSSLTPDLGVDKHKYDRFLQRGIDTVASFYAPVCIGPAPVVALQHELNADLDCVAADGLALVGVGSVLKPDTNRIVLRKAVLTGVAIRVKKRNAVVATMFHNPEDVNYFKPIELWTKQGRSGHIVESVGTHGRMKCTFDGSMQQNDTICMSLYARQFPPWPYADAELRQDAELFARARRTCRSCATSTRRTARRPTRRSPCRSDSVRWPVASESDFIHSTFIFRRSPGAHQHDHRQQPRRNNEPCRCGARQMQRATLVGREARVSACRHALQGPRVHLGHLLDE